MASMEGYLQALSLVAILILAPMTIHLLVHKEDNTVFVFVETNNDEQHDEVVVAALITRMSIMVP